MTTIKDARKRAGLTQAQASEKSGIPLGTLRRWEQGINEPSIESIVQLADLYSVSTDELLGSSFASIEYSSEVKLSDDERKLIGLYRRCTPDGRRYMMGVAETTASMFGGE